MNGLRCVKSAWFGGGFKNKNGETLELPMRYVDEMHLWEVYRRYVHDGVNSAKTAVTKRCGTQGKGEFDVCVVQ